MDDTPSTSVGISGKLKAAVGGQIGVFLFGFATQIVIARALGPEGKGAYSLILLAAGVLFNLTNLSLGTANAHFTGRRPRWNGAIIGNSLLVAGVLGALVAMAGFTSGSPTIQRFIPGVDPDLVLAAIVCLPALLALEYMSQTILGQNRVALFSGILTARELLNAAALIALAALGLLSLTSAVSVWLSAAAGLALFSAYQAIRRCPQRLKIQPSLLLEMGRFSLLAHIASFTGYLRWRVDMFIIAHYLPTAAVGWYSVAMMLGVALWWLPTAVSQVLLPHISHRDDRAGNSLTPKLARISLWLNLLAGALIVAFGLPAIRLMFGRDFTEAFPPLTLLIPGMVLFTFAKLLPGDLAGRGKPQYATVISVLSLILSVVGNLIFIPRFGLMGAAAVSSVTHSLVGAMFLLSFLREAKLPLGEVVLLKYSDLHLLRDALRPGRRR